ncbi:DUF6053 domain-containing protein [Lysobacter enzymogenes]|uniref:DUF6053 domain-containing protein n=1 Tax=Lysobacter enzymogenes TaxID=69 RepID=UPI003CCDB8A0
MNARIPAPAGILAFGARAVGRRSCADACRMPLFTGPAALRPSAGSRRRSCRRFAVGGASAPTLSAQATSKDRRSGSKSIGPEGPLTKADVGEASAPTLSAQVASKDRRGGAKSIASEGPPASSVPTGFPARALATIQSRRQSSPNAARRPS